MPDAEVREPETRAPREREDGEAPRASRCERGTAPIRGASGRLVASGAPIARGKHGRAPRIVLLASPIDWE